MNPVRCGPVGNDPKYLHKILTISGPGIWSLYGQVITGQAKWKIFLCEKFIEVDKNYFKTRRYLENTQKIKFLIFSVRSRVIETDRSNWPQRPDPSLVVEQCILISWNKLKQIRVFWNLTRAGWVIPEFDQLGEVRAEPGKWVFPPW